MTRARQRIDERRPRYDVSPAAAERIENVVLVADGGGKPGALLKPLKGAGAVARAMLHAVKKHGMGGEIRAATVNGLPGFVRFEDGHARAVLAFGLVGGRIEAVFVMSNPEKLRHLRPTWRSGEGASARVSARVTLRPDR